MVSKKRLLSEFKSKTTKLSFISKLIKTTVRNDYTAFEINADYKFAKKYYVAGEIGHENHLIDETQINLNTKGSYLKIGVDYNAYQNWLNMENAIYAGLRYGFSSFSQTLNSYSIFNTDDYWQENNIIDTTQTFDGSSSHWVELIFGIKAEVLKNVSYNYNRAESNLVYKDISNLQNVTVSNSILEVFNTIKSDTKITIRCRSLLVK